jgi:hypothetical protein
VNTNTVEGRNGHIKSFLKSKGKTNAINEDVFWGNLAQYMWEAWYGDGTQTMRFAMLFMAMFDKYGFEPSIEFDVS